jgi:hypothetical protein
MAQETFEWSFKVPSPAKLAVSNIRGSVTIEPGEEEILTVAATRHLDSGDASRTRIEAEQAADGSVRLETRYGDPFGLGMVTRHPCKVDYLIRLPSPCSLYVSGVSSTTSIHAVNGDIRLKSVSGSLTLQDLQGDLVINSVSGDIAAGQVSGSLDVETVSGDVRLASSALARLTGSTISGDLRLESSLGEGPHRFDTISGDMRLILPAGTACTVYFNSLSGRLQSSIRSESDSANSSEKVHHFFGGGTEIRFKSLSGDLRIQLGQSTDKGESGPSSPERRPTLSRQEVLDRIARGEMSVDEALRILS